MLFQKQENCSYSVYHNIHVYIDIVKNKNFCDEYTDMLLVLKLELFACVYTLGLVQAMAKLTMMGPQ